MNVEVEPLNDRPGFVRLTIRNAETIGVNGATILQDASTVLPWAIASLIIPQIHSASVVAHRAENEAKDAEIKTMKGSKL
jgi:hypothetical protein|tara:strand:+ start:454 stop:693 length:240 start_codon:yes stop_codon:yes gene_type:complete